VLAERRRVGQRLGLVRAGSNIILRVGTDSFYYPAGKFERDVGAWNNLLLAGLAVSGGTSVKLNYPDDYEYRWILDPVVEKYPGVRSDNPADYYALLLLTEDVSYLGGRPGPASLRTIGRIARLVRRGWELWEEDPEQLESPLLTARLLLASGYFDCRDKCSEYHENRWMLRKEFTLLSTVFTEELYEQYARDGRPVPGVEVPVNDNGHSTKTRLHLVFLENIILGILDGTLGGLLGRTLRRTRLPVNVRIWSARADKHDVYLEISSSRLGGERVLYKYSIAQFTNLANTIADNILKGEPGKAGSLLLSNGTMVNVLSCDKHDIVLAGDHATLVAQKDGRIIGKYKSIHDLRDALLQLSRPEKHTRILWKLCENLEKIRKYAPSITGGNTCPVLDEIILARETYYIGRAGPRYAYIRMSDVPVIGEPGVGIGDTIYSALPRRWNIILETLSTIGMHETRKTLEEADQILRTALHDPEMHTKILVKTGPCPVIKRFHADRPMAMKNAVILLCPDGAGLSSLFSQDDEENPLKTYGMLETLRYEYERTLAGLLERHGWKDAGTITNGSREEYRVYEKNNTYIVYVPEK